MARRKRRLEMLPLLDVFMVVLFVFATIQEGKLSATTEESQQLQEELEQAQSKLQQVEDELQEADVEATQSKLDEAQKQRKQLAEDLDKTKKKVDELEEKEKQAIDKVEEMEKKLRQKISEQVESSEEVRREEILEKLLDQHSVFEVEIRGTVDPEEGVVNHCCYRTDPRAKTWKRCGEVPVQTNAQADWFRAGGDGLLDVLRNTKGGNAMTIIRHDATASHRIGQKLESLIREQVTEQKVYNEGIAGIEMACQPSK